MINWRLFLVLWVGAIASSLASIPYTKALGLFDGIPLPFVAVVALQLVQSGFFFGIAIFVGLLLAERVNLGLPFVSRWLEWHTAPGLGPVLCRALGSSRRLRGIHR